LLKKKSGERAGFIILLDPDKLDQSQIPKRIARYQELGVENYLIGSSQPLVCNIHQTAALIKKHLKYPLIIFPGSPEQITPEADAILFISLISGRNPEYLIGNHVKAAPVLKKIGLKVIPAGYILIESGHRTSVELVSETKPLPADDVKSVVAHALAGEMLGMQYIYLEAGSGAERPVSCEMISAVKKSITVPLIVGGGIRTPEIAAEMVAAGADFLVVGNFLENNDDDIMISKFMDSIK